MLLKFICCDVFTRVACDFVSKSPHVIDIEFVPMLAHTEPEKLNLIISGIIEKSIKHSGRKYDAVMLGYGLCGNSVIGLSCPVTMVIPKVHDCCTVFMGGREKFLATFGDNLSARWSNTGYSERCHLLDENSSGGFGLLDSDGNQLAFYKTSAEYMGYVEQYGEDNADYIWETMHPDIETDEAFYIKSEGCEYSDTYERYRSAIEKSGKKLKVAEGDNSMLKALIYGEWDEDRFLIVPPGKKIIGIYDMQNVMMAGD